MNNEVRQKLYELIVQYGRSLCDDPQRCQALLKDYCGKHKREIFVLVNALRNRVAEDLLKTSAGVPQSLLLGRLVRRLEDELGLAEDAAHWAVESWAFALSVLESPLLVKSPIVSLQVPLPAINPQPQVGQSPEIIEGFGFVANPADLPPSKPLSTTALVAKSTATLSPTTMPVAATSSSTASNNLLADRYRDNNDGTVTDVQTGLQWMRFSLGQQWKGGTCVGNTNGYSWQAAQDAATALNRQGGYSGYRDWRVPTKEELLTLVYCSSGRPKTWNDTGNPCQGYYKTPTIDHPTFPNTPSFFWSSSVVSHKQDRVWCIQFSSGAQCEYSKLINFAVRLVRGKSIIAAAAPPKKPPTIQNTFKPTGSSDNNTLGFLVFLILHPHFALGLGLVVFLIIMVGYKMVSNAGKALTKKITETSVAAPTATPSSPTTESIKPTTPSGAIIFEKANAGDTNAQFKLGFMYANGQDVPKDDIEAVRWYRRAADQGFADAKNNLRFMYANNRGIPSDTVEMAKWYRQAAEYGYASAQNRLGRLYDEGEGVPKDAAEAAKWYRLAAAQGDVDAQKRLSSIISADRYHDFGDGTVADIQTNLQWMRCSLGQNWNGTACLDQAKKYPWQAALDAT